MDKKTLYRYFEGKASYDEKLELKRWMEESEENSRLFYEERKLFDILVLIKPVENTVPNTRRVFSRRLLRMAATVIITVICTSIFFLLTNKLNNSFQEVLVQTINVPVGQRINLDLPDGTNVWLNSGTTLKYPVNITNGSERWVTLDGEGYFKVAADEKKPFIVKTYAMNVKVLGTEFNVSAYSERQLFETSLIEGKVALNSLTNSHLKTLTPNNKATLDSNGQLQESVITDYDKFLWRDGLYSFKSKRLHEIIVDLERYYNTKITLESDQYNKVRVTGKFRIKDDINSVIKLLQNELNFQFDYNKEKNEITIR